jgi:hypothetical protein
MNECRERRTQQSCGSERDTRHIDKMKIAQISWRFRTVHDVSSRVVRAKVMKLRHVGALALVGWYLMIPPPQEGSVDFNIRAPLSEWKVIDSYVDVGACERGRIVHLSQSYASSDSEATKEAEGDAPAAIQLNEGLCIASNDPRLKSK